MAQYWVDYTASMMIEADSAEDARADFYQVYCDDTRQFAEVTNVEMVENED